MKVAYVVYPDFTALDLVGPYEIISRWPAVEVHFVASSLDPVRTDRGLTVIPTDTPATLPDPDLIVVPGSENPLPVLEDRQLIAWLRAAAPGCAWTASVCSGAGLYGVDVVPDGVVWEGTHISGAGVSAGIDMALSLTERVHGRELAEALQLIIEYDPEPPFDSGSPTKADAKTRRLAKRIMLGDRPVRAATRFGREIVRARMRRARGTLARRTTPRSAT